MFTSYLRICTKQNNLYIVKIAFQENDDNFLQFFKQAHTLNPQWVKIARSNKTLLYLLSSAYLQVLEYELDRSNKCYGLWTLSCSNNADNHKVRTLWNDRRETSNISKMCKALNPTLIRNDLKKENIFLLLKRCWTKRIIIQKLTTDDARIRNRTTTSNMKANQRKVC